MHSNRTLTTPFLLAIAAGLTPLSLANADVLQVPGDFPTIQIAINLASADDEIIVAPGAYFEDIDFLGKRLTLRSTGGPTVTTIDAIGRFEPVITILGGSADGSIVEGFTLRNGQATDTAPGERGGALFIDNANVTVRDCVLVDNLANIGGALYANASVLVVENSVIESNEADIGGGFYLNNCNATIAGVIFTANTSNDNAAAMIAVAGNSMISGCEFLNNFGRIRGALEASGDEQMSVVGTLFDSNSTGNTENQGRGGAFYCGGTSNSTLINCTFRNNSATAFGGALYAARPLLARNCTFVGNTSALGQGLCGAFSATLQNCIAWDNGASSISSTGNMVTYSIIEGGFAGTGNIGGDSVDEPIFVDGASGDFRLAAGSPGIDAGNSTLLPATVASDFNGEGRVINALESGAPGVPVFGYYIDMGAFEFQPDTVAPTCLGDTNGDGVVDLDDLNAVLTAFGLTCP